MNDAKLESRVKKAADLTAENMMMLMNEPSLALYRINDHVRRSAPSIVKQRQEVETIQKRLQSHLYDVDYSISAVNAILPAASVFANIRESLRNALFHRQQLAYEEKRSSSSGSSMYDRLSCHLSLEIDNMQLGDAWRDFTITSSTQSSQIRQTENQPSNEPPEPSELQQTSESVKELSNPADTPEESHRLSVAAQGPHQFLDASQETSQSLRTHHESPEFSRTHQETPHSLVTRAEFSHKFGAHREGPYSFESHRELPQSSRSHRDSLQKLGAHQEPSQSLESHQEPPNFSESNQEP